MEEIERKNESHSVENNVDKAGIQGNVSSEASVRRNDAVRSSQSKPRLKLFQKVMEKSLQWLVDNAG